MKNESTYRILIIIMLGSILAVQIAILNRTAKPITAAQLNAAGDQKTNIIQNIPLTGIVGDVNVEVKNGVEVHSPPFHF